MNDETSDEGVIIHENILCYEQSEQGAYIAENVLSGRMVVVVQYSGWGIE
jgi:hypothetical protein